MGKVLIYRGIQGSGKTYFAKGGNNNPFPIQPDCYFSNDDFWIQPDGSYKYEGSRMDEALAATFRRFIHKLITLQLTPGVQLVVDNTNITRLEIEPYVRATSAFGLDFEIITIWCDPIIAIKRNTHKVPPAVILGRYGDLLKEKLPSHWKQSVIFNS